MPVIKLNLSKQQLNKFNKSKPFQLKHSQLTGQGGGYEIEMEVPKTFITKYNRSSINGKGIRIPKGLMEGAKREGLNLLNVVKNSALNHVEGRVNAGVDKVGRVAKRQIKSALDRAPVPGQLKSSIQKYADDNIDKLKANTKGYVSQMSKRISEYGNKSKKAQEDEEVYYDTQTGDGFGSFIKNVGKTLKPIAKPLAKAIIPVAATAVGTYVGGPSGGLMANQIATGATKGMGLKGSQAMKDKMSRIRAMRKTNGKGMFGNIAKGALKAAAPIIVKSATDMAVKQLSGTTGKGIVVNPRKRVLNSTLLNGVPQVKTIGSSYAGFKYA